MPPRIEQIIQALEDVRETTLVSQYMAMCADPSAKPLPGLVKALAGYAVTVGEKTVFQSLLQIIDAHPYSAEAALEGIKKGASALQSHHRREAQYALSTVFLDDFTKHPADRRARILGLINRSVRDESVNVRAAVLSNIYQLVVTDRSYEAAKFFAATVAERACYESDGENRKTAVRLLEEGSVYHAEMRRARKQVLEDGANLIPLARWEIDPSAQEKTRQKAAIILRQAMAALLPVRPRPAAREMTHKLKS